MSSGLTFTAIPTAIAAAVTAIAAAIPTAIATAIAVNAIPTATCAPPSLPMQLQSHHGHTAWS